MKTIIRTFQFRSSRDASIVYSTLLYNDGTASCSCPGWCKHTQKDGGRSCKHLISAGLSPVSETSHGIVPSAKKPGKHGASAKVSVTVVRRFRFDDE